MTVPELKSLLEQCHNAKSEIALAIAAAGYPEPELADALTQMLRFIAKLENRLAVRG